MISSKEKEGLHYPPVKKLSTFFRGITLKHHGDFIAGNVFILLE